MRMISSSFHKEIRMQKFKAWLQRQAERFVVWALKDWLESEIDRAIREAMDTNNLDSRP